MADVDMTDAPAPAASSSVAPAKKVARKSGVDDGKKRFEVKKVRYRAIYN